VVSTPVENYSGKLDPEIYILAIEGCTMCSKFYVGNFMKTTQIVEP